MKNGKQIGMPVVWQGESSKKEGVEASGSNRTAHIPEPKEEGEWLWDSVEQKQSGRGRFDTTASGGGGDTV